MSARSLNKVILIGNLTRDPELRYTPSGTGVCTFGLATNRSWTTQSGETREEAEFHRIVVWNKLAELCAQLLTKGRKVYVEGRLSTHAWTAPDGTSRSSTEVVIEDMILLDSKRPVSGEAPPAGSITTQVAVKPAVASPVETVSVPTATPIAAKTADDQQKVKKTVKKTVAKEEKKTEEKPKETANEDITPDDIPF